jgi:hypothetical protein
MSFFVFCFVVYGSMSSIQEQNGVDARAAFHTCDEAAMALADPEAYGAAIGNCTVEFYASVSSYRAFRQSLGGGLFAALSWFLFCVGTGGIALWLFRWIMRPSVEEINRMLAAAIKWDEKTQTVADRGMEEA